MNAGLEIVPAINKIDLPSSPTPERTIAEIEDGLAIPCDDASVRSPARRVPACTTSSRPWCATCPAPEGDPDAPAQGAHLRLRTSTPTAASWP